MELILQDPLTRRGLRRPRGFTPDAMLLDLFYREQSAWPLPRGTTSLGNQIYGYVSLGQVATAMRSRCAMLTAELNRIAAVTTRPDILILGCAHLRELRASTAFRQDRLGRVVAIDQDERAISQLSHELASSSIDCRHLQDINSASRQNLGRFDFVYSLNLLERLNTAEATKLVTVAFHALKAKRKLWLGSLNANGDGAAWLEAMMNWHPICRDASELRDLANRLPVSEIASLRTFPDPHDRTAFIEIIRT
jgi:hypothetical protein